MGDKFQNKIKLAQQREARKLSQSLIPPTVAINKSLGEHGHEGNYRLIFRHYNHAQCELNKIQSYKPLIDKFNEITMSNYKTLRVRGSLYNSEDYQNLFNSLPPDVDHLEEIKFADTGRIIFFKVATFLCVVAILITHRRT